MVKKRLDQALVEQGLVATRSQAESYVKLGQVFVNGKPATKAGFFVGPADKIKLNNSEQLVSRAGLKLASVAERLNLDFKDKTVLDVGSSTGGFTDYALKRGAKKVIAVDVGTNQLHPSLRNDARVELHEKTDIRDFKLDQKPDVVLIDVSFISLKDILPSVVVLSSASTVIIAMVKPQFEAGKSQTNKGLIKNDSIRRQILRDFEDWAKDSLEIITKADSEVAGAKGNLERFYSLKAIPR